MNVSSQDFISLNFMELYPLLHSYQFTPPSVSSISMPVSLLNLILCQCDGFSKDFTFHPVSWWHFFQLVVIAFPVSPWYCKLSVTFSKVAQSNERHWKKAGSWYSSTFLVSFSHFHNKNFLKNKNNPDQPCAWCNYIRWTNGGEGKKRENSSI